MGQPRLLFGGDGVLRWFQTDTDGKVHEVSHQDVEPILEENKRLAALGDRGYNKQRNYRRVGTIPNVLAEKWLREEGIDVLNPDHWLAVKRKLNDPDYRWLRSSPGRV